METEQQLAFIRTLLSSAGVIFIIVIGVILLTQQFKKNLYKEELKQVNLRKQYQNELLKSTVMVQEKERKRISQDLHDDLGAVLSIIRMHLLQLERKTELSNTEITKELVNIRSLAENAMESMRRISHELMPPQLERFGVLETLEQACRQISATGKIKCKFSATEQTERYITDELLSLTIYRMGMELINNTIKHAGATELQLTVEASEKEIMIHYFDNGKGLNPDDCKNGAGMKNMHNRVNLLGGKIIFNTYQAGLFVTINLPTN